MAARKLAAAAFFTRRPERRPPEVRQIGMPPTPMVFRGRCSMRRSSDPPLPRRGVRTVEPAKPVSVRLGHMHGRRLVALQQFTCEAGEGAPAL